MIPDTASLWAGVRRFEDILSRDPLAYSFAPLADLYRSLGLLDDALQAARKGCAVHPDFAAGQMALARAAVESSLKAEAKSALEAVVRVTPENLEAQRLLADLYTVDGDQAAALRCLNIVNSLELVIPEPIIPTPETANAAPVVEELGDDDILELTDDLIEVEPFADSTQSPFSAVPARPSLGDAPLRAEPFMVETAPPFHQHETVPSPQHGEEIEEEEAPAAVVASPTIAELYVSQGFPDRAVEIYKELLQGEPDNAAWKERLAELSAPVVMATAKEVDEGVLETLCGWLANIGRIRECRSKRA